MCADWRCPNMYKCPDSYCIHYKRICDGHKDCINGEDELTCENYYCPGKNIPTSSPRAE